MDNLKDMEPKDDHPKLAVTMFMGMSFRNFISSGTCRTIARDHRLCFLTLPPQQPLRGRLYKEGFEAVAGLPIGLIPKIIFKGIEVCESAQYYLFFLQFRSATMEKYVRRRNQGRELKWLGAKL
ncbi:MAG: hypothetical protein EOP09_20170, partial [Proteobacteria bacterium]